jgi:hypothetical protein
MTHDQLGFNVWQRQDYGMFRRSTWPDHLKLDQGHLSFMSQLVLKLSAKNLGDF